MASPVDSFSKTLVAAGLMTAEELMALWSEIPVEKRPQQPAEFANLLVERGKLTKHQAQELIAGRGARLVMGDYVILREIGAGGMGQVYQAQHRRMKRLVALKVMSSAAMRDEAAVKRFQREVQAAARLEHENIVTAYASGESGDVKYLVMQFVDGGDLSQLVKRDGPLPIERAVDYVLQAAAGLAYAHREGVIHRDIKPANLLLDKKGIIKILDMGLARIEDGEDGLTATEQVMGTVDYMSPEQAANTKTADARADIYSLGCTLWYLLTGKKAYEADTMIGRLMAHRDAPLPSLVKTRDDAPWPLEQALHKMLAKRAQDRFQTMEDVIAALAPYGSAGSNSSVNTRSGGSGTGGGRSAEMAAFMQAMTPGPAAKPGGGAAATTSKSSSGSKTSLAANLDVTQQFDHSEADTDPKSAIRNSSAAVASAASAPSRTRPTSGAGGSGPKIGMWIAGGIGVMALVVGGIIVMSRAPQENVVAESSEANAKAATNTPAGANVAPLPVKPPSATNAVAISFVPTSTTQNSAGLPVRVDANLDADRKAAEFLNGEYRLLLVTPSDGKAWNVVAGTPLPSEPFRITRIIRESSLPAITAIVRENELLPVFEPLTHLEELNDGANRMGLDAASLERLAKAPCGRSLRSLVLGAIPSAPIITALGRFPQLDSVRFVATSVTDADMETLKQLPARIKRLAFYDFDKAHRLTDAGRRVLSEITPLDLVFEANDAGLDAKTFAALAANPKLRSLTFRNSGPAYSFGDADLAELGRSKSLRLIDLHPPKKTPAITDAGIRTLATNMPRCTFLWSGGTITARNAERFLTPKPGEVVDLMPLIDPEIHAHKGRWEKQGSSLLTSPEPDPCSLELPVEPAPAYRLEAMVERVSGTEGFGMVLTVGTSEVRLLFDGYRPTGLRSGLDLVDGKRASEQPDAYRQEVFKQREPTHIVVDVAPDRVLAVCNGITVVDFQGDAGRLSIPPRAVIDYRFPPKTLSLMAYRPQCRVTKLTYMAK
jgi:serine/threonine protein kinase